jgi:hypothetical protein
MENLLTHQERPELAREVKVITSRKAETDLPSFLRTEIVVLKEAVGPGILAQVQS